MKKKLSPILVHIKTMVLIDSNNHQNKDMYSPFSRRRQLGGRVPALRLGVPPRCKANKLSTKRIPPLIKERTLVE